MLDGPYVDAGVYEIFHDFMDQYHGMFVDLYDLDKHMRNYCVSALELSNVLSHLFPYRLQMKTCNIPNTFEPSGFCIFVDVIPLLMLEKHTDYVELGMYG